MTLCQVFGYIYNRVRYILIQTIQTYTYTYKYRYMYIHAIHAYTGTYMHVPITVRRDLWGAVADAVCLRE